MITEINFTRCFVNGFKAGVLSTSDGAYLLHYKKDYEDGSFAALDAARRSGEYSGSLHSFQSATKISTPDATGIRAFLPDAEIDWENDPAYIARVNAAQGSRPGGGNSTGKTSKPAGGAPVAPIAPAPVAVAAADTFTIPSVDTVSDLADILKLMAPARPMVEKFANEVAAALLAGQDMPGIPDEIKNAAAFAPVLLTGVTAYANIIKESVNKYQEEKKRKEEEAAAAAAAAAKAAAAAANGKNLITLADGSAVEVSGRVHPAFAEICQDLKDFGAVYLYGPAGTGKSFMSRQLAEALGLDFYMSGKADLKYDLIGAVDINGKLMETAFYKAFANGGLWLWDEVDRSAADACTAINEALANGYCDFPGVGLVKKHPNFKVVAAGNSIGRGSGRYAGAQVQDEAVLTRFLSKIKVDYCPEMDMIVTDDDKELCAFVAAVRSAIESAGVQIDLAIRLLKPMQTKAKRFGEYRALETGIFAGLEKSQIRLIAAKCSGSNKWFAALEKLAA